MRSFLQHTAFALAMALGATSFVAAQTTTQQASAEQPAVHHGMHRHHDPARETAHLTKKLGLSPEQAAEVQPILAERQQKMHDLRASRADRKTLHQQRHAILQESAAKLNAVLTPSQQQQFAAIEARHHHGHAEQNQNPAA